MFKCEMCFREFKSINGLANHLRSHKIGPKEYYLNYINKEADKCIICGNETNFIGLGKGFIKHCSAKCISKDIEITNKRNFTNQIKYGSNSPLGNLEIQDKIKKLNLEKYGTNYPLQNLDIQHKCRKTFKSRYLVSDISKKEFSYKSKNTLYKKVEEEIKNSSLTLATELVNKFGQGWLHKKDELEIKLIHKHNRTFVSIQDVNKIEEYFKQFEFSNKSFIETQILNSIKKEYKLDVLENVRNIIAPYELDIYIPELNLAIEYNGTYWHSNLHKEKDYHLNKSILCREKGIRLIHIYEFEDFNQQIYLLKELILGNDLYNKLDFNKNNIVNTIPRPELIYKKENIIIYGAGPLYENS